MKNRKKKLTDREIRKAVEKIRNRYADYMVTFQKDRHTLNAFEERYISAMRARMGLDLFLHAEMTVVEELFEKETERIEKEAARVKTETQKKVVKQGLADRVLEEHRDRIVKYPRLMIHDEASEELERLFGALGTIEREFWADLEILFRDAYASIVLSPRGRLVEQFLKFCGTTSDPVPPRVSRYQSLFDRFPRSFSEIDKEEKKCVIEAAFFLHDLKDTIEEIASSETLGAQSRQKTDEMKEYVANVIDDFRLKEFKNLQR